MKVGTACVVLLSLILLGVGYGVYVVTQGQLSPDTISIRFVDVQKVFDQSEQGKAQNTLFKQELDTQRKLLEQLQNQANYIKQEALTLQQQGKLAAAQQKAQVYSYAQQKADKAKAQANATLAKTQSEVDQAFMKDVREIMEAYRIEHKVDIIQSVDPQKLLSYDPGLDITPEILSQYNKTHPAKTSAAKD